MKYKYNVEDYVMGIEDNCMSAKQDFNDFLISLGIEKNGHRGEICEIINSEKFLILDDVQRDNPTAMITRLELVD